MLAGIAESSGLADASRVGASLTAATVMVEVAADELAIPSFTTQEMVRLSVLGLSEVLL